MAEPLCVHGLFEAQVKRSPDAVAVVFGSESLTYRELESRSNQLAHLLQARGAGSEDRHGARYRGRSELGHTCSAVVKT